MKYIIEDTQIKIEDKKYEILSGELNNYSLNEINTVINEIENVFIEKYPSSSFCGKVVFSIEYNMSLSTISYYNEFIGKEPTIEIYQMLIDYRDALLKHEDKKI